jgi:hypothetical protein
MNNDISDLLDQAEFIRERRPATMVTALRIDLDTQSALESAAAARGIGATTLIAADHRGVGPGQQRRASRSDQRTHPTPRRCPPGREPPRQPRRGVAPRRSAAQDPDYSRTIKPTAITTSRITATRDHNGLIENLDSLGWMLHAFGDCIANRALALGTYARIRPV